MKVVKQNAQVETHPYHDHCLAKIYHFDSRTVVISGIQTQDCNTLPVINISKSHREMRLLTVVTVEEFGRPKYLGPDLEQVATTASPTLGSQRVP